MGTYDEKVRKDLYKCDTQLEKAIKDLSEKINAFGKQINAVHKCIEDHKGKNFVHTAALESQLKQLVEATKELHNSLDNLKKINGKHELVDQGINYCIQITGGIEEVKSHLADATYSQTVLDAFKKYVANEAHDNLLPALQEIYREEQQEEQVIREAEMRLNKVASGQ